MQVTADQAVATSRCMKFNDIALGTIARRELTSYFYSPIAYVAMAVFLLACGFTFWDDFQPGEIAGMRNLFNWMVWLLVSSFRCCRWDCWRRNGRPGRLKR